MESYYFFIALIAILSYNVYSLGENFKGASVFYKNWLTIVSSMGFLSFLGLIIYSFFITMWWHVLLLFVLSSIISPLLKINVLGYIASIILPFIIAFTIYIM